ncbi:uncharacterized protein LOC126909540 [Daktulosphaira vitifoliae]|uniref:uncharacterized protein LOC126909540 n=1 Tax=Daktulosphaira vitifoliae TaxID=58002 RepID=UPI0021AAEC65|nr:uncharacterized protein LOC126909540 [Daktulosphaira vitifoliae]
MRAAPSNHITFMKMESKGVNVTASGDSDAPVPAVGGGRTHQVSSSIEYAPNAGVLRQAPAANHGVGTATAGSGGDQATPTGEIAGRSLATVCLDSGTILTTANSLDASPKISILERLRCASKGGSTRVGQGWVTPYSCMSNKRKLTTNTEYYATKKMKQTTDDDIDKPNGLVLKVWKLNETPTFSLDTKTSPRVYSSNNASTTTESIDIDSAESDNDGPSLYDVPPRDLNEKKKNPPSYDSFLTATTWYSGDTINAYLSLIASRSQGKVHYLNTDFMEALSRRGYAGVKRWIKIDIHSLKLLLVPMHVNGNHWTMTVVDVPEKTITFFDSLNSYNGPYPSLFRQFLIEWEIENYGYSSQWTLRYGKAVQQRNGYDCGPLSLELAEKMSRDDGTPINPLAMPYVRLRHKYELEAGTLFQF